MNNVITVVVVVVVAAAAAAATVMIIIGFIQMTHKIMSCAIEIIFIVNFIKCCY
jgi:hypothetical protein